VNGLMLAATPANGGHYFVDLFAGIAIAVVAIIAARQVGHVLARRPRGTSAPAPVPAQVPVIVPAE
jgi:PAP2 superfamily